MNFRTAFTTLGLAAAARGFVLAATVDAGGLEFFEKRVRPVLVEHCYECHSAEAKKLKGKLRLDTRRDKNLPIPFARLGDSSRLAVGQPVLAMGNPLTLSSSMTLGIVGNPSRVFTSRKRLSATRIARVCRLLLFVS